MIKISPLKYNISPTIKAIIKSDIKVFSKDFNQAERNKFGRMWHALANYGIAGIALVHEDYGWVTFLTASALDFDKMFHNIAMRKLSSISRKLQSVGINDTEELRYAGNYILKKEGGVIWSNIYRLFHQDKIAQIMQGKSIPHYNKWSNGFVYNLQMKYGIGTMDNAYIAKKLRIFNKLKKFFNKE